MNRSLLFSALAALVVVSCADTKELRVYSDPSGAQIDINGKAVGVTPLVTTIKQDKNLAIVAHKPGYQVATTTINTQTNWWRTLLWTEHDPKARFIEEDDVKLHLMPIPSSGQYKPAPLPAYINSSPSSKKIPGEAPALRPMPGF